MENQIFVEESERSPSQSPRHDLCSICLCRLKDKAVLDVCFHEFCFTCIKQWIKIKQCCPLCKQSMKIIMYNVRSDNNYDEYRVTEERQQQVQEHQGSFDIAITFDRHFRYATTMTSENRRTRQRLHMERQKIESSRSLRTKALLARSRWTTSADERVPFQRSNGSSISVAATSVSRRHIYESGFWAENIYERTRDVSARFLSENPACCHRLLPWLNREVNALLGNGRESHSIGVIESILKFVKKYDILSDRFFYKVSPIFGERTKHFIHEFYSFAKSPYDVETYDKSVVYKIPKKSRDEIVLSSDSDNDDIIDVTGKVINQHPIPGTSTSDRTHNSNPLESLPGNCTGQSNGNISVSSSPNVKRNEKRPRKPFPKLTSSQEPASSGHKRNVDIDENAATRKLTVDEKVERNQLSSSMRSNRMFYSSDESDEDYDVIETRNKQLRSSVGLNLINPSLLKSSFFDDEDCNHQPEETTFNGCKKHRTGHKNRSRRN